MHFNYFYDHLFDLLNDSELLDVRSIEPVPQGYRVTVLDGAKFVLRLEQEASDKTLRELLSE